MNQQSSATTMIKQKLSITELNILSATKSIKQPFTAHDIKIAVEERGGIIRDITTYCSRLTWLADNQLVYLFTKGSGRKPNTYESVDEEEIDVILRLNNYDNTNPKLKEKK
jgi:hypothetical protein